MPSKVMLGKGVSKRTADAKTGSELNERCFVCGNQGD